MEANQNLPVFWLFFKIHAQNGLCSHAYIKAGVSKLAYMYTDILLKRTNIEFRAHLPQRSRSTTNWRDFT